MAKKKKVNKKGLIIAGIILLVAIGAAVGVKFLKSGNITGNGEKKKIKIEEEKEPEITVVDVKSKSRPFAVMVNNIPEARAVQSGLNKAYIVYEILAEGGITRYLALFRDQNGVEIGSVRSARHYYLDYVLENDAIYAHFGWSPQAQEDISSLHIDNINGLTYDGSYYYRINKIAAPHNAFTTTDLLKEISDKRGYKSETDKGLLLQYSGRPVDLSKYNATDANTVIIDYSNYSKNKYVYDEETKKYTRYVNGSVQIDHLDESPLTVKNIIIYRVENYSIANDPKGRQMLNNIGSGDGYYITEGKVVPIKWSKKDRASKTVYTYEDGTEIKLNDGNTWIQIVPLDGTINME